MGSGRFNPLIVIYALLFFALPLVIIFTREPR